MIGAAVGGLLGLMSGNRKDAAKGAAIGAAAGAGLGALDGYRKAKLQQGKMNEVAAIQSTANDVRVDSAKLQAVLDTSTTVLREGTQRLAALSADLREKRVSAAAEGVRKREEENLEQMRGALKTAQKTRDDCAKVSESFRASQRALNQDLGLADCAVVIDRG